MNRTIKFRGKSIYDEEWLYGSLIKIEKDRYAVIPPLNDIEIGKSIGMYEVCLETIGQFTGLYDRSGEEIYEGDIISVNGKYPKIVKYIDGYACFCLANISDLNKKWMYPWQQVSPGWWSDYKREIRVVANIYDNPELIKEE
ncbi:YopX family protein [Bacteroides faecis]|uniref:YopX family protein n=1 Tax=Bacteroides faecis TaxID=674529 RepID=UPI0039C3310B